MPLNYGQIIERRVRICGYSISALARLVNVNRRSVYNWFNQPMLKTDIIYQIGHAIEHDFSIEFPDLFKPEDFQFDKKNLLSIEQRMLQIEAEKELIWKERYLALLERFTKLREEEIANER
jgi:lambda repressor-like predicted transcriptional regulator